MTFTSLASRLLAMAELYLAIGAVVAVAFVGWGVARVDPHAARGTWGFRLVILPGSMLLWPLLLRRWLAGASEPPAERNAHRDALRAERRAGR